MDTDHVLNELSPICKLQGSHLKYQENLGRNHILQFGYNLPTGDRLQQQRKELQFTSSDKVSEAWQSTFERDMSLTAFLSYKL